MGASWRAAEIFLYHAAMRAIWALAGGAALLLYAAAAARHALHWSNLWDLGIFDQGIWLISQGVEPVVTTLGFHILGDHASLILYPIALAMRLWPDVHLLFALQACALALTALPIAALARQAGLAESWIRGLALCGLLYPAVCNVALYDFHPEVFAVPALLWAVLAGSAGRYGQLAVAVAIVLATKEVLGLTVAALGVTLWLQGRRGPGLATAIAGLAWFCLAAFVVIPHFAGQLPAGVGRYSWILRAPPLLLAERLLGPATWIYLALLLLPVAAGLRARSALHALPALPLLLLNLLSQAPEQRDLIHQYTVPIFPFLLVWLVHSVAQGPPRWLRPGIMALWSVAAFLALGKAGYFLTLFRSELATRPAERAALSAVSRSGGVLAPSHLGSHLAHRKVIDRIARDPALDLSAFHYVIVDLRRPGWASDGITQERLLERLLADPERPGWGVRLRANRLGPHACKIADLGRRDAAIVAVERRGCDGAVGDLAEPREISNRQARAHDQRRRGHDRADAPEIRRFSLCAGRAARKHQCGRPRTLEGVGGLALQRLIAQRRGMLDHHVRP